MGLKNATKGGKREAAEPLKIETLEVKRAKEFSSGAVGFDCVVNGITIYGMTYHAETGADKHPFIAFPARKADNEKYYNHVWFKIAEEDIPRFEELIDKALASD